MKHLKTYNESLDSEKDTLYNFVRNKIYDESFGTDSSLKLMKTHNLDPLHFFINSSDNNDLLPIGMKTCLFGTIPYTHLNKYEVQKMLIELNPLTISELNSDDKIILHPNIKEKYKGLLDTIELGLL